MIGMAFPHRWMFISAGERFSMPRAAAPSVDKAVKDATAEASREIRSTNAEISRLQKTIANLETRLAKRDAEIERQKGLRATDRSRYQETIARVKG